MWFKWIVFFSIFLIHQLFPSFCLWFALRYLQTLTNNKWVRKVFANLIWKKYLQVSNENLLIVLLISVIILKFKDTRYSTINPNQLPKRSSNLHYLYLQISKDKRWCHNRYDWGLNLFQDYITETIQNHYINWRSPSIATSAMAICLATQGRV